MSSKVSVQLNLDLHYELVLPENPKAWVVLLHGYTETGARMLKKCREAIPEDYAILAPNGPFLVPTMSEMGAYREGYAWYFYDRASDEYIVEPKVGVSALMQLLAAVKRDAAPVKVVGFSQGGYLAPFVGQARSDVDQVIVMGGGILVDELEPGISFRLDALHGEKDDVVDLGPAEKAHAKLKSDGVRGEFVKLPETGHRIDERAREALKKLLLVQAE